MDSFLHYLYWDKLDPRSSPEHTIAVLHVAHYYGATCLVGLGEALLAKVLKKGDKDDEGEAYIAFNPVLIRSTAQQVVKGRGSMRSIWYAHSFAVLLLLCVDTCKAV